MEIEDGVIWVPSLCILMSSIRLSIPKSVNAKIPSSDGEIVPDRCSVRASLMFLDRDS
jgi:hypothetical protein